MSKTIVKPIKSKDIFYSDLVRNYPNCFNETAPRPLKLRINQDLIDDLMEATTFPEGTSNKKRAAVRGRLWYPVEHVLADYCTQPTYLAAIISGATRIDLDGQPAGIVTEREAAYAAALLRGETPPPRPPRAGADVPALPADAPLSEDNIVPGNLEITVKFSKLPVPVAVQAGMKIGIRTDNGLVEAILPPKAWKKLAKAANEWTQWGAILTGRLSGQTPSNAGLVIRLEQPALQVFEKKEKPVAVA